MDRTASIDTVLVAGFLARRSVPRITGSTSFSCLPRPCPELHRLSLQTPQASASWVEWGWRALPASPFQCLTRVAEQLHGLRPRVPPGSFSPPILALCPPP